MRRQRRCDHLENAVDIPHHVVVPETQCAVAAFDQPLVSDRIARVDRVLPAVNFDDHALLAADEVHDIWTDRFLANKLVTIERSRAKTIPEAELRLR